MQSKVTALLAAATHPISRGLLIKWIQDQDGDSTERDITVALDTAVQSGDVQCAEGLYSIPPNRQADVSQRLKGAIEQTDDELADLGLDMWGISPSDK